ncbi:MAG: hypothetical protein V1809_09815 [Planctomycetota bacterium]
MKRILLGVAAAILVAVPVVLACNIPVFRYALERWEPDSYEYTIFTRGKLTPDQEKNVAELASPYGDKGPFPNLRGRVCDVDGKLDKDMTALWAVQKDAPLPWLVLRYPGRENGDEQRTAWTGAFTEENVRRIVDSPARREVARRILAGESAVWVMLESGDRKRDDAAVKILEGSLVGMTRNIRLPEEEELEGVDMPRSKIPLKIAFSTVRLSAADPNEAVFRAMILKSSQDPLPDGEPVAIPVVGRGRALFPLAGSGINPESIEGACSFAAGPCSCQVKDMNPGVDLIMAVDWAGAVGGDLTPTEAMPALRGFSEFMPASPAPATPAAAPPAPAAGISFSFGLVVVAGVILVVVAVVTILIISKRGQ